MALMLCTLACKTKVVIISGGSFQQFSMQVEAVLQEANIVVQAPLSNIIFLPVTGTQCYQYDDSLKHWQMVFAQTVPMFSEETKKEIMTVLHSLNGADYGIPTQSAGALIEDRGSQITLSALGQNAEIEQKEVWDPKQQKRQKIQAVLAAQLPNLEVSVGGTTSIDILPKGYTKGTALQSFIEKNNIDAAQTVFVGDALYHHGNDSSVRNTAIKTIATSGPTETLTIIEDICLIDTQQRPWGNFKQYTANAPTTVKIIEVNPNELLSLQSHTQRSEFWHVISGTGAFEIDGVSHSVQEGDEYTVPIGSKHRMSAVQKLSVLEVAQGTFDENDIIRYEDKYGRV